MRCGSKLHLEEISIVRGPQKEMPAKDQGMASRENRNQVRKKFQAQNEKLCLKLLTDLVRQDRNVSTASSNTEILNEKFHKSDGERYQAVRVKRK